MVWIIIAEFICILFLLIRLDKEKKKTNIAWEFSSKHLKMFEFMNKWTRLKQSGKNMSDYFINNGYMNIAIYGMGSMGETLVNELNESAINIKYGIDRNPGDDEYAFRVIYPDSVMEEVDVIVITSIYSFKEIKKTLENVIDVPIVSIEEVLYGC